MEAAKKEQETDSLLDDLLSPAAPKEAAEKETVEQEVPPPENPREARTGKGSLSGPLGLLAKLFQVPVLYCKDL